LVYGYICVDADGRIAGKLLFPRILQHYIGNILKIHSVSRNQRKPFDNSCCCYLNSLSCWSISSKGCFDIAPSYFCKFTGTSKALIMLKIFKFSNCRKSSSALQSSIFRVTVVINKNIENSERFKQQSLDRGIFIWRSL